MGNSKKGFWKSLCEYFYSNLTPVTILTICLIFASFNLLNYLPIYFDIDFNIQWNKSWELWAAIATVIYSFYIHNRLKHNKHLKLLNGEDGSSIYFYNTPLILLCFVIVISSIGGFADDLNDKLDSRNINFLLLIIAAMVYCRLNWKLHVVFSKVPDEIDKYFENDPNSVDLIKNSKSFYEKMVENFRVTVFSSEMPNILTFLLLYGFYYLIKFNLDNGSYNLEALNPVIFESIESISKISDSDKQQSLEQLSIIALEYFVSGAIAFQMLFSNAVWVFNDDNILEQSPVCTEKEN